MVGYAVSGILIDAKSVLLVSRESPEGVRLWAPPGGKVECGETLKGAAFREFSEETGLKLVYARQVRCVEISLIDRSYYLVVFSVKGDPSKYGHAAASSDATALEWVQLEKLHQLKLAPGVFGVFQSLGIG